MTSKLVWSQETLAARNEATNAIEKFLRSRKQDMLKANPLQETEEELKERHDVSSHVLSAWVVSAEFVNMGDMEESIIAYGNSGCTPATQQGLVAYAVEDL